MLSNHQRKIFSDRGYIPNSENEPFVFSSGAFSPDNRFLYVCENDSIMQYSVSKNGILGEKYLLMYMIIIGHGYHHLFHILLISINYNLRQMEGFMVQLTTYLQESFM